MTWPLPDRPKLPPLPTREERRRARAAELDAIEAEHGEELPRGVRRRDDGSWYVPYWRRDDVWMVGGAIFSIVLLVGFLAYWTGGFSGAPSDGITPPSYVDEGELTPFWWAVAIAVVAFLVALVAGAIWSLVRMLRAPETRYEDVSPDEQARRREVARLLKQIEPPVSLDEAQRQLGQVPPDGPGDPQPW